MSTIPTPPETTLSENSDTELDSSKMPPSKPIYLIVATALKPAMGIGLKGELPWPALKKDMSFFRRITSGLGKRNAVIMGRKTWDSIPVKFRPLKGRINVVVTRKPAEFDGQEVVAVSGLEEGMEALGEDVGRVFVIGGSQIYQQAMGLRGREVRVLQTQVRRRDGEGIECDTFFPVVLDDSAEWRQVSGKEAEGWVDSETVPGSDGWEADGEGMEIRVVAWERSV
jgi:dihydrofolate reductase